MPEQFNPETHQTAARFLTAYGVCGSISQAAKACQIDRKAHYRWMRDCPGYAEQFDQTNRELTDHLEGEAYQRASEGMYEPLIYKGVVCYDFQRDPVTNAPLRDPETNAYLYQKTPLLKRTVSDSVLLALLRKGKPDVYATRSKVEHTGPNGGAIAVSLENELLKKLTAEQLQALKDIRDALKPDETSEEA